jgi:predicted nucleic acid-binding protein
MTNQPASRIVVADAGPLIHLDELDSLDLLNDFGQIIVPDAVWREVQIHRPAALQTSKAVLLRSIVPKSSPVIDSLTPISAGKRAGWSEPHSIQTDTH